MADRHPPVRDWPAPAIDQGETAGSWLVTGTGRGLPFSALELQPRYDHSSSAPNSLSSTSIGQSGSQGSGRRAISTQLWYNVSAFPTFGIKIKMSSCTVKGIRKPNSRLIDLMAVRIGMLATHCIRFSVSRPGYVFLQPFRTRCRQYQRPMSSWTRSSDVKSSHKCSPPCSHQMR